MIPNARLTHLGLFVHDSDRMSAFYTSMFGMVVSDRGEFEGKHLTFLTGTQDEHHQVVLVQGWHVVNQITKDGAAITVEDMIERKDELFGNAPREPGYL